MNKILPFLLCYKFSHLLCANLCFGFETISASVLKRSACTLLLVICRVFNFESVLPNTFDLSGHFDIAVG